MRKMLQSYYRVGTAVSVLTFLCSLLAIGYLNGVDGPYSVVRFQHMTGGLPLLDLEWNYSANRAYQMLDSYGELARAQYARILVVVDIVLPPLYGLGIGLLTARLIRAIRWPWAQRLRFLSLLPLGATIADYLENIMLAAMLGTYPSRLEGAAAAANVFTMTKTVLTQVSLALLVLLAVVTVIARLTGSSAKKPSHAA